MLDVSLFLGFPVDPSYIAQVNSQILELFLRSRNDEYLHEVFHEGIRYFGKFAGQVSNVADLGLLQKNIYSLLKKLSPDYPYEQTPLVLFVVQK